MKKKLGLALMFIGAYITLLGGLFFLMHFYGDKFEIKPKDYEWCWGVLVAIVMLIGTVFACKKYTFGLVGFGIAIVGFALNVWLLLYAVIDWDFLSPYFLISTIVFTAGIVIGLVCHVRDSRKAKKYGESLL